MTFIYLDFTSIIIYNIIKIMTSFVDLKFINKISSRLERFKEKKKYLFNFRCPYCGDSKKSKWKSRGYFYRVKVDMFYKCFNCGIGANLANFLKKIDHNTYKEYVVEKFRGNTKQLKDAPKFAKFDFKPTKFIDKNILDDLKKISDLQTNHPARRYLTKRKIPEGFLDKLYLCDNWQKWVNKVKPGVLNVQHPNNEAPRLIIPFFDINDEVFAFQGRAFGKELPKYMTIKLDESKQKVFGLERINLHEKVYIVEGPLDSLFLPNSLAAAGSDLDLRIRPENQVYIFDNEPRNKEIVARMYKCIDSNNNIVVWPNDVKEKDINEMVISGKNIAQIRDIISKNIYNKLSALTKLNNWKRC